MTTKLDPATLRWCIRQVRGVTIKDLARGKVVGTLAELPRGELMRAMLVADGALEVAANRIKARAAERRRKRG